MVRDECKPVHSRSLLTIVGEEMAHLAGKRPLSEPARKQVAPGRLHEVRRELGDVEHVPADLPTL